MGGRGLNVEDEYLSNGAYNGDNNAGSRLFIRYMFSFICLSVELSLKPHVQRRIKSERKRLHKARGHEVRVSRAHFTPSFSHTLMGRPPRRDLDRAPVSAQKKKKKRETTVRFLDALWG